MEIAVVSDTHRYGFCIKKILEKSKGTDMLLHLGDNVDDAIELSKLYKGKILYVSGNCDFKPLCKKEELILVENKKILMTHGNTYGVKYGLSELIDRAKELSADLVLYGHTHVSKVDFEEGIFFVNPGSPSIPRDGFKSMARVEIKNGKIIPTIVNLG